MVVDVEMKSDMALLFSGHFPSPVRKIIKLTDGWGMMLFQTHLRIKKIHVPSDGIPKRRKRVEGTWPAHVRPSGVAETEPGGERRDGAQRPARPALESEQLMAMT